MVVKKSEIIKQVQLLIEKLKQNNIIIEKAILFGSYSSGNATEDSDIDIAFISKDFKGIRFSDTSRIIPELINFDSRFDVHPYSLSDYLNKKSWFIHEIIKTGEEIPIIARKN